MIRYDYVDWAVYMIFWQNADVDKVKDIYFGDCPIYWCQSKWFTFTDDGQACKLDVAQGTKEDEPSYKDDWVLNMRVYSPHPGGYEPDPELDRFYNDTWGYYVLGTCHCDEFPEVPFVTRHGYGEESEEFFCQIAADKGYPVDEGSCNMSNEEPYREEGKSIWLNDEYASMVQMPWPLSANTQRTLELSEHIPLRAI